jgi:hypothetical protein
MRARSGCTSTSGVFCGWGRSKVVLARARPSRPRRGWVGGEAAAPPRQCGGPRAGRPGAGECPQFGLLPRRRSGFWTPPRSATNPDGTAHLTRRGGGVTPAKRSCCAAGDMALCAYPVRSGAECPGRTTEGLTPLWGGESFSRARVHALKGPEAAAPDLRARPNLTEPDTRVALYVPISVRKAPNPIPRAGLARIAGPSLGQAPRSRTFSQTGRV